jgi:hypothetical protein
MRRDPLEQQEPGLERAVLIELLDDRVADVCDAPSDSLMSTQESGWSKRRFARTIARKIDAVVKQVDGDLVKHGRALTGSHLEPLLGLAQAADVVAPGLSGAVGHLRDGRVVRRRLRELCQEAGASSARGVAATGARAL